LERVLRYERQPGYQVLCRPGQAGLERLEFGLLRVARDDEYRYHLEEREAALVILSGECTVAVDGQGWNMARVSVFAEPPTALYLPRHREFSITAAKPADVAVLTAPATRDYLPRLIGPDMIEEHSEGAGTFRRRVRSIVGQEFPASRLLVGETLLEPGGWGSYPPHKHDEDRYPEEVRLEQVGFFQVDPPQGFGLQYQYSDSRELDEVHVVHNDEALAMARGYHPLAAAPGYRLYHLWGMAGDGHVIRSSVDPAHAWVVQETGAPQPVAVPQ
jgi:5-deoxy-glucuronate isomerase